MSTIHLPHSNYMRLLTDSVYREVPPSATNTPSWQQVLQMMNTHTNVSGGIPPQPIVTSVKAWREPTLREVWAD